MKETTTKTTTWLKLLLRTLTWEKVIIFWVLGIITYFVVFITINPPPPPDISYFTLIIGVVEKLISWVVTPLIGGAVVGTAGGKVLNNINIKKDDIKNE